MTHRKANRQAGRRPIARDETSPERLRFLTRTCHRRRCWTPNLSLGREWIIASFRHDTDDETGDPLLHIHNIVALPEHGGVVAHSLPVAEEQREGDHA